VLDEDNLTWNNKSNLLASLSILNGGSTVYGYSSGGQLTSAGSTSYAYDANGNADDSKKSRFMYGPAVDTLWFSRSGSHCFNAYIPNFVGVRSCFLFSQGDTARNTYRTGDDKDANRQRLGFGLQSDRYTVQWSTGH
jgi:hypothetical protein